MKRNFAKLLHPVRRINDLLGAKEKRLVPTSRVLYTSLRRALWASVSCATDERKRSSQEAGNG